MDQRDVVREGDDEIAAVYDEHRSGGASQTAERALVDGFVTDLDDGSRVLDAGCGAGRPILQSFDQDHETVGLDISTSQLQMARQRVPAASLAQGDLGTVPFDDETFDAVVSF
jgi:ubiquinone/menaquinone biosynthesis C-methylase UbiE